MLSVGRRLASEGLVAGATREWMVFDPATMQNSPVTIAIGDREVVTAGSRRPIPAFKVQMTFSGLTTTAWVTDTGEIVREESPMGLITVLETQEQATALAVSNRMQRGHARSLGDRAGDGPRTSSTRPRDVERLRLRMTGADLSSPDLQGDGQRVDGNIIELIDPRRLDGRHRRRPISIATCSPSRSSRATRRRFAPRPSAWCRASPACARAPSG